MFLFLQFPPDRLLTDAREPSEVAAISKEKNLLY